MDERPDPRLARVRAVLLDMDGTLVDSSASVERAWFAFADDHGLDHQDTLREATGSPARVTVRRLATGLDPEGVDRAVALQSEREADLTGVGAAEGALDLLADLDRRGTPWAVVTSADTPLARARLGAAGIDPPVLVTADDVAKGKPDPRGYLDAARMLDVPIGDCLVVEDSAVGAAAGVSSGALVAGLAPGLGTQVTVTGLAELHRLLIAARVESAGG